MIVAASTPARPSAVAASRVRFSGRTPRDPTASVTAVPSATGPIALKYFLIARSVRRRRCLLSIGSSYCHPGINAASPKPREPASRPEVVRFTNRKKDSIVRVIRENSNTICVRFAVRVSISLLLELLLEILEALFEIADSHAKVFSLRAGHQGAPF